MIFVAVTNSSRTGAWLKELFEAASSSEKRPVK
jgi:hypothetical protein